MRARRAAGPTASVTTDRLKAIFDEVDGARITQLIRELSGVVSVTVNGASIARPAITFQASLAGIVP